MSPPVTDAGRVDVASHHQRPGELSRLGDLEDDGTARQSFPVSRDGRATWTPGLELVYEPAEASERSHDRP